MTRHSVLVIDDERDVIELVRYNLEKSGFDVLAARDGKSGLAAAKASPPDLVLLDLMMPEMDGLEVCRSLRKEPKTARVPVIMLTAKASEADRVVGLEMGADDYIVKPFSPRELVARVKAVLRRATLASESGEVLKVGDLAIDVARHEVIFKSKSIELTATEFRVLQYLATRAGRVASRTDIIDGALERDAAITDRTVDVHVTALRKKLGKGGDLIETVRGFGYKIRD
jgi:DNA-binding response OmpR family regulator